VQYKAGRRTALAAGARAQHLAQLPAQLPAQLRGQVAGGRAARGRGLVDEAQELGLVAVDQRQQLRVLLAQLLRAGYRVGLHSTCPAPARRSARLGANCGGASAGGRLMTAQQLETGLHRAAGQPACGACSTAGRAGIRHALCVLVSGRRKQAVSVTLASQAARAPWPQGLRSHARCHTHAPVDQRQAAPACGAGDPQC